MSDNNIIQARATAGSNLIDQLRPTSCRFCNSQIFLKSVDFGEFIMVKPYDYTTSLKHHCKEALENYIKYNMPKEPQQQQQQEHHLRLQPKKAAVISTS